MKKAKNILGFLMVALIITFTSCEEEIERNSTHTDASALVGGTYTGTLSFESDTYNNVTITLTKMNSETIQAVDLNIQGASFTYNGAAGINLAATVNVAKANDSYSFSSGFSSTLRLSGRLKNNDIVMQLPIQVRSSNQEVRFHTNGNDWVFVGTKN
ncbi:MAG: hypothetical protein AB7S69_16085 [Salinivirgaceae bacterium]